MTEVERTIRLRFGGEATADGQVHQSLSAVRTDGRALWVAGDETATLERLVSADEAEQKEYADHVTFRLGDLVQLPAGDEEADIEGLARSGRFLWAVGSHSLRRKKIKAKHDGAKAVRRLAEVQDQPNRHVLVRIPVREDEDGLPALVAEAATGDEREYAAALGGKAQGLRDLLQVDEHLAPFLPIPGKDNGFDIEGVAVHDDRLYLGLRGPVLRGWALVLELRPGTDPDDPRRLRLRPFEDGAVYRKHVLDLDGLGIRDLCSLGNDLLVLAGPTMDLDGPVRVYRWVDAWTVESEQVVRGEARVAELDLQYGTDEDHAEGIALIGPPEDGRLLVVYDSPAPQRLADDAVLADVVRLPKR